MLLVKNKKALFNYTVLHKFIAGIVLKGYEVKAVREKNVNFEGSYIKFINDELYVVNMHIGTYSKQSQDPDKINNIRDRKVLLNKREILKLKQELQQKGKSAVPLAIVLRNNLIKLEFGVVAGKKKYEKKIVAKEKQIKRELEKSTREYKHKLQ